MATCVLLNIVAVKWYGEAEFIMASTKIILLAMLVLITIITMSGGNPTGEAYGFRNWSSGAMHSYVAEGAAGRFLVRTTLSSPPNTDPSRIHAKSKN